MKSIKITYVQTAKEFKNYLVEISLDYPKFRNSRKCFLYELFYIDAIEDKINQHEEERIQYNISNSKLTPFFIKIDDEVFNELQDYLQLETEYEECRWQDEVSLLNAILGIYRNDPKSWE